MLVVVIYDPHNGPLKQSLLSSHCQEGSGHTEVSDSVKVPSHPIHITLSSGPILSDLLSKKKSPLDPWADQAKGSGFQVNPEAASKWVADFPILRWHQSVSEMRALLFHSPQQEPSSALPSGTVLVSEPGTEAGAGIF